MKTYNLICCLVMLCVVVCNSCKEIIEPSLAKRAISLQAPADSLYTKNYTVNFWWNNVDDALQYRLQIVSGSFKAPEELVADTVVSNNKFTLALDPGVYQWRIRAENGASATNFSDFRTFFIELSSIKSQTPRIVSPGDGALTSSDNVLLKWLAMYGATKYHLQVDTKNFENDDNVDYDGFVPGLQLNYAVKNDGEYQWRIRAENDTAASKWSLPTRFVVDRNPPPAPIQTKPISGTTVDGPVTLQWSLVKDAKQYKLYVFRADSTTYYNKSFPVSVNTTSYLLNSTISDGTIYWQVAAVDAAGNEGKKSTLASFSTR